MKDRFRKLMATTRRKLLILAGLVLVIPAFTYGSVELTSTPGFCRACHEIEPVYQSWSRSPHAPARGKDRAGCRDCHVSSWTNPLAVIWDKLVHGTRDAYHHFASADARAARDFYFRLKQGALMNVTSETCLRCHEKVRDPAQDVIGTDSGPVRGLHTSKELRDLPCTMCHRNTGHEIYQ